MSVQTIEAFIENGQIKLPAAAQFPDHTKVYVLIPDAPLAKTFFRIASPHLVHRDQAADFKMEVSEDLP